MRLVGRPRRPTYLRPLASLPPPAADGTPGVRRRQAAADLLEMLNQPVETISAEPARR